MRFGEQSLAPGSGHGAGTRAPPWGDTCRRSATLFSARPRSLGEGARHTGRGRGTEPRRSGEGQVRDTRQGARTGAHGNVAQILKAGQDLLPQTHSPTS